MGDRRRGIILQCSGNADFSVSSEIKSDGTDEVGIRNSLETLFNLVGRLILEYDLAVEDIHSCFKEDFITEFEVWLKNEMEQGNKR